MKIKNNKKTSVINIIKGKKETSCFSMQCCQNFPFINAIKCEYFDILHLEW